MRRLGKRPDSEVVAFIAKRSATQSALGGRRREEPGMPVRVAGGVAASVGKVFWRFDDLCPRSLRPFVVRVDIGQIDEDALGCRVSLRDHRRMAI